MTHHRNILQLGFPIAIGQIGILVQNFADTMMVGQYDTSALAAAAFVNSIFAFVLFLIMGYAMGITPILSGLYGKRDYAEAGNILKHGLLINAVYSTVILLLMGVFYFFLDSMGQPPELLPLIRSYYITIWISMFFVAIFQFCRQLSDATLDTRTGMWILLLGNIINIIGNFFLIYGVGPFPEWGLLGAGISTLISRLTMAIIIICILGLHHRYQPFIQSMLRTRISRTRLPLVHRQSYPVALQMGMESGIFSICTIMAGWIGKLPLATYQVMTTMSLLGYLIYVSFAGSTSIRISLFVGQKDWDSVRNTVRAGVHIQLILASIISLFFIAFGRGLLHLFTSDLQVITMGLAVMYPMIMYQFADALQVSFGNSLRGLSHVKTTMWVSAIGYILVGLPACYYIGVIWLHDISGLLIGLALALCVSTVLYYYRLRHALRYQQAGYDHNGFSE